MLRAVSFGDSLVANDAAAAETELIISCLKCKYVFAQTVNLVSVFQCKGSYNNSLKRVPDGIAALKSLGASFP